jgi:hypothetical protein
MADAELDEEVFGPICAQIEAKLGREAYYRSLKEGKSLDLDAIVSDILGQLWPGSSGSV